MVTSSIGGIVSLCFANQFQSTALALSRSRQVKVMPARDAPINRSVPLPRKVPIPISQLSERDSPRSDTKSLYYPEKAG